ncbi:MAG TPA: outer membrane beta-barrel protein [Polyangiaceae bacterium]|nr:outer membrane beta-barrel protein [Polyangiaceae bacterium]
MPKLVVFSSALALALAVPALASAQSAPAAGNGTCPPGSWFCGDSPQPVTPAGQPVQPQLQALPDPDAPPPPPPPPRVRRLPGVTYAPAPSPPPVVVYQPPPPVMVVRPETPPPYEYAPPPSMRRPGSVGREWGLNLHLEGASIGGGTEHNAGMGGAGAGLRFKPNRYFGLETDLDWVGGHGYVGDVRHETALSFNALMFLNPRSRAQLYLLAGFGWTWANSQNDPNDPSASSFNNNYSYFGGQAGVGLEIRLTRVLALNVDLRGFVRSRTDQGAQYQPEFTNSQGQQTNTSGGGLLTGGMTLYF